jgi:hypothetical protein
LEKAGMVIVFWQSADDLLHEGAVFSLAVDLLLVVVLIVRAAGTKLESGTKYIMRSDVMYTLQIKR